MTDAITGFLAGTGILYLVLGVLAAEALLLVALTRRGVRLPLTSILANLAAGAFLVLATLVVATGGWWGLVGIFLGGAFVAHLVDLRLRLGGGAGGH
jgi:hypothetical protein